jgi:hypothetical protein
MILVVSDNLIYIKKHFKPVNNKPAWDGRFNYLASVNYDIINRTSVGPVMAEATKFCNILVIQRDSVYGYSIDAESHTIRLLLKYSAPDFTVQFDTPAQYEEGVEAVKGIFFV